MYVSQWAVAAFEPSFLQSDPLRLTLTKCFERDASLRSRKDRGWPLFLRRGFSFRAVLAAELGQKVIRVTNFWRAARFDFLCSTHCCVPGNACFSNPWIPATTLATCACTGYPMVKTDISTAAWGVVVGYSCRTRYAVGCAQTRGAFVPASFVACAARSAAMQIGGSAVGAQTRAAF